MCENLADLKRDYDELRIDYENLHKMYDVLEKIIENSADAFWVFDAEGKCIRVNAAYEELIGLPREKLIGIRSKELVGSVVSEICTERLLKTRKPVTIEQEFFLTEKTALVTATPVFDSEGNLLIGICNDRDINTLQRLREQLQKAKALALDCEMKIRTFKTGQFHGTTNIIAEDARSKELLEKVYKVAQTDATVLISGETGVGKEEIAKLIHQNSRRSEEAFVRINCGAISPELIESELFGYERGSFTGANCNGKLGLFEVANQGTVFLDEIGELPLQMQVKLLRVLQEHEITRVGGTKSIKIDIRVVAATNRDLQDMVAHHLFRMDLFYRINVFPIQISPLRERPDDIIPLAMLFLKELNDRYNGNKQFSAKTLERLRHFEWTGNVRELRNCVEQAFIMSEGDTIFPKDLRLETHRQISGDGMFCRQKEEPLEQFLHRIEYEYLKDAYEECGNVRAAAKLLHMSPATFVRKRALYSEEFKEEVPGAREQIG